MVYGDDDEHNVDHCLAYILTFINTLSNEYKRQRTV